MKSKDKNVNEFKWTSTENGMKSKVKNIKSLSLQEL